MDTGNAQEWRGPFLVDLQLRRDGVEGYGLAVADWHGDRCYPVRMPVRAVIGRIAVLVFVIKRRIVEIRMCGDREGEDTRSLVESDD